MATTRSFGIITDVTGVTGGLVINSLSFSETSEIAECRGEKGEVLDLAAYSKAKTVNITGYLDSSKGALATAGSKITLQGKDWIIDSVSKNESNSTFVEVTISARTADSAIITIIGEGTGTEGTAE